MKKTIKNNAYLYIAGTVLLLSYGINLFGVGLYSGWFNHFEDWSENFVNSTIICEDLGKYTGGLVESTINRGVPEESCSRYTSQLGLQGYLYANTIGQISNSQARSVVYSLLQVTLMLLTIVMLLLFIVFAKKEYGQAVAVTAAMFLSLSPWLAGFADNLYWVLFLMLLPFIFSLYVYPKIRVRSLYRVLFYVGLFFLFALKFATGYEYISVIILSAISAILYWEFKYGTRPLRIMKESLAVGLVGVAAFVSIVTLQLTALSNDYGGFTGAVQAVSARGEYRASGPERFFPQTITNFEGTVPEAYETLQHYIPLDTYVNGDQPFIVYTVVLLTNYLLLPVIQLPVEIKGMLGVLIESFVFWGVLAGTVLVLLRQRIQKYKNVMQALAAATATGLIGVMSWFVFAPGHAYEHAHINAIIYYIPMMLWVSVIVSLGAKVAYERLWQHITK